MISMITIISSVYGNHIGWIVIILSLYSSHFFLNFFISLEPTLTITPLSNQVAKLSSPLPALIKLTPRHKTKKSQTNRKRLPASRKHLNPPTFDLSRPPFQSRKGGPGGVTLSLGNSDEASLTWNWDDRRQSFLEKMITKQWCCCWRNMVRLAVFFGVGVIF